MTTGQRLTISDLIERQAVEGIYTIEPTASVQEAARTMQSYGISAISVVDTDGVLIGILSEKDISHLVAAGQNPAETSVAAIMTERPITVNLGTPLGKTAQDMINFNIRHLPVVDRGRPVTTISMRDVLGLLLEELQGEVLEGAAAEWLGLQETR